jgi:pyruvate formate lyase activating enzyme
MKIGGLEKLSLLDYPNNIAAIIFTQGCNFRCGFCYNPMLVWPTDKKNKKGLSLINEKDLFLFLRSRLNRLDGVVISGGEPTIHSDLPSFIKKIKDLGLLIKLDTNGTNPEMLDYLWQKKLIDYVAMDLKAPWNKYEKVVACKINCSFIKKSVKLLIEKKIPHEFRTTLIPKFHKEEDIIKMGEMIKGADAWFLQKFVPSNNLLNSKFSKIKPYNDNKMKELAKIGEKYVKNCKARGLNN